MNYRSMIDARDTLDLSSQPSFWLLHDALLFRNRFMEELPTILPEAAGSIQGIAALASKATVLSL
jgi:hypothetical protein